MTVAALQVSGIDGAGAPILSVLAKRRYRLEGGRLVEGEDEALLAAPVVSDIAPELLLADSDLYAYKPATDVVVLGTAHPPASCKRFNAHVRVAGEEKREKIIEVLGRRRILRDGAFTVPEEVEPTRLDYADAFGGEDSAYLATEGHPLDSLRELLDDRPEIFAANPFAYPRNPCGKGFSITGRAREDGLDELPRFDDPADPLTPQRRSAGEGFVWAPMPIPAGLGWFGLLWFPRCVYFGIVPDTAAPQLAPEVRSGALRAADLERGVLSRHPDARHANGASPGLAVPWMVGGEQIVLENLSSTARVTELRVPAPPKRMRIDGRKGRLTDVEPVLSSIVIEPDREQVTVVWRGTGRALRPYGEEEVGRMPFEVVW